MREVYEKRIGRSLTRREFLYVSVMAAGSTILAACGGNANQVSTPGATTISGRSGTGNRNTPRPMNTQKAATEVPTPIQPVSGTSGGTVMPSATQGAGEERTAIVTKGPQPTLDVPKSFNESPTLAKQVNAGKLPPVEQRLPQKPMVIRPTEMIGKYGGTWHTLIQGIEDLGGWLPRTITYEPLVRWNPGWTDVIPNVAASFEAGEDGTEYRFELRKGMKWSDGQPFSVKDVMFWYEDVFMNEELTPAYTSWLTSGGKPVQVRKTGDHAERNPYYWKVDTEGNQLPYLDSVEYRIVQQVETMVLDALNGEVDLQARSISSLQNKPLFYKNRKRGNYHLIDTIPSWMNTMTISLNLTHPDATKRKVFQNKDFRIGLSHAINRQEIIDVVYQSQGEPWQAAPRPEAKQFGIYNEKLAKQYTEYNAKRANEYLDKVLPKKDPKGVRLGPDGKPLTIRFEVATTNPTWADALNLVQRYWRQVGIDMQYKTEEESLFWTRVEGNEHDAAVWQGDSGLRDAFLSPFWYFPYNGRNSQFAVGWGNWYSAGGLQGKLNKELASGPTVEPPSAAKKQMQLYDQLLANPDAKKRADLMQQILDIAADEFWLMGVSLYPRGYCVVKNDFRNTPKIMFDTGGRYPNPAPTDPEQYFVAGG